jgi:hypothetical protein
MGVHANFSGNRGLRNGRCAAPPHNSTHCGQYVGWTGSGDPVVEMTFETETQRIWRIRKQFRNSGSSVLQESKNGQDFDDVERGRKVDGKLREILRWGIPETGGMCGAKGLPTSFLATALLSPQEDVSAVLRNSLQEDPTGSGKEQIAAALQAVAQDPLFVAMLRETQARRDAAYTDKGAKKTAKGSVFKAAAERLNDTRDEKEKLQRIVAESGGAERQLRELTDRRARTQETLGVATDLVINLERLSSYWRIQRSLVTATHPNHFSCMPCSVPRWTESVLVSFFLIRAVFARELSQKSEPN